MNDRGGAGVKGSTWFRSRVQRFSRHHFWSRGELLGRCGRDCRGRLPAPQCSQPSPSQHLAARRATQSPMNRGPIRVRLNRHFGACTCDPGDKLPSEASEVLAASALRINRHVAINSPATDLVRAYLRSHHPRDTGRSRDIADSLHGVDVYSQQPSLQKEFGGSRKLFRDS